MKQPRTKSLHLLLLFATFLFIPLVSFIAGAQYFWGVFFEGTVHVVGEQSRIAKTHGEIPMDGYHKLRTGVINLTTSFM